MRIGLFTVLWISMALFGCAGDDDTDGDGDADSDADTDTDADTDGDSDADLCNTPTSAGYLCMSSGCPTADWGYNADFASSDDADDADLGKANSGGNGLDWALNFTDRDTAGQMPATMLAGMMVPDGTTTLNVTKFLGRGGNAAQAMDEGEPFVLTSIAADMSSATSGSVTLEIAEDCSTIDLSYDVTLDGGATAQGSLSLSRAACPPCD